MLNLFLNTTDNFLYSSVKIIFEKTEKKYIQAQKNFNLTEELKKFKEEPLGCMIGSHSMFETKIKIQVKLLLGLFFVLVPFTGFAILSYLLSLKLTYSFLLTFLVAIFVAIRIEEIAERYVQERVSQLAY
jgi:hypothetical protein